MINLKLFSCISGYSFVKFGVGKVLDFAKGQAQNGSVTPSRLFEVDMIECCRLIDFLSPSSSNVLHF